MCSIHTPRLTLIPLDYSILQDLLIDPARSARRLGVSLVPGIADPPVDRAIQIKLGKMRAASPERHAWLTFWLIVVPGERTGVGMAGFKGEPDAAGAVEIGYGIHPDYQNQGYMTEVVARLLDWAFSQPECQAVTAETFRANLPSQRVLEKTGFALVSETADSLWWRISRPTPAAAD